MGIFALLINPRDGSPFYGEKTGDRDVEIFPLDDSSDVGSGYFNNDKHDAYGQASMITELPRAHTPSGVGRKGKGLGTVLYTALCAAAHLNYEGDLSLPRIDVKGDGISSNSHRSASAEAWWTRAKDAYGLAYSVEGCAEETFEESFSPDTGSIEDLVRHELPGSPDEVEIEDYSLTASGRYNNCGLEADAYPWERAEGANLVAGVLLNGRESNWSDIAIRAVEPISKAALAAINVGAIREYGAEDGHAVMTQILELAQWFGLSARAIEGLKIRYLAGADIDPSTWDYPDFASYSPARQNPSPSPVTRAKGRRGGSKKAKIVVKPPTLLYPRRLPVVRPKFYGRTRLNPGPGRNVLTELARLNEERAKLGWAVFAADKRAP